MDRDWNNPSDLIRTAARMWARHCLGLENKSKVSVRNANFSPHLLPRDGNTHILALFCITYLEELSPSARPFCGRFMGVG